MRPITLGSMFLVLILCMGGIIQAADSAATVVVTTNYVEVLTSIDDVWERISAPYSLQEGTRLRTGSESRAILHFADGSQIILNEETTLEVTRKPSREEDEPRGLLRLIMGALFARGDKDQSGMDFESPNAVATIRGTTLAMRVTYIDPIDRATLDRLSFQALQALPSRTRLTVGTGQVFFSNPLGSVMVGASQSSEVVTGNPPREPVDVPIEDDEDLGMEGEFDNFDDEDQQGLTDVNEQLSSSDTPLETVFGTARVLRASASPPSGGVVSGGGLYRRDDNVKLVAEAASGYEFVNWTRDGMEVSREANFTYVMPSHAVELVATFAKTSGPQLGIVSQALSNEESPDRYVMHLILSITGDFFEPGRSEEASSWLFMEDGVANAGIDTIEIQTFSESEVQNVDHDRVYIRLVYTEEHTPTTSMLVQAKADALQGHVDSMSLLTEVPILGSDALYQGIDAMEFWWDGYNLEVIVHYTKELAGTHWIDPKQFVLVSESGGLSPNRIGYHPADAAAVILWFDGYPDLMLPGSMRTLAYSEAAGIPLMTTDGVPVLAVDFAQVTIPPELRVVHKEIVFRGSEDYQFLMYLSLDVVGDAFIGEGVFEPSSWVFVPNGLFLGEIYVLETASGDENQDGNQNLIVIEIPFNYDLKFEQTESQVRSLVVQALASALQADTNTASLEITVPMVAQMSEAFAEWDGTDLLVTVSYSENLFTVDDVDPEQFGLTSWSDDLRLPNGVINHGTMENALVLRFVDYWEGSFSQTLSYQSNYEMPLLTSDGNPVQSKDAIGVIIPNRPSQAQRSSYTVAGVDFHMRLAWANEFPIGTTDSRWTWVERDFWIAETPVTYELWHKVKEWASSPERGEKQYFFIDEAEEGSAGQSGEPTERKREPVTRVHALSAILWLNALTEYYNEQYDTYYQPVYVLLDSENEIVRESKSLSEIKQRPYADGFRLPTSDEWELAARYNRYDNMEVHPHDYYMSWWTPGNHASGASAPHTDEQATNAVAWYVANTSIDGKASTQDVGQKQPNGLGLFDMSGNVWEWTFTVRNAREQMMIRGGDWKSPSKELQVGYGRYVAKDDPSQGFRIVRSSIEQWTMAMSVIPASETKLRLTKEANKTLVEIGDVVTYTITFDNTVASNPQAPVNEYNVVVQDTMPMGLSYLPESLYFIDGDTVQPVSPEFAEGVLYIRLSDNSNPIAADSTRVVKYQAVVTPFAKEGREYTNRAIAFRDLSGNGLWEPGESQLTNESTASVEVIQGVFSPGGTIVGMVFLDSDHNGWPSNGELGFSGARIISSDGTVITTDSVGAYSLSGLRAIPITLKLDPHSLPAGYVVPVSRRLVEIQHGGLFIVNFPVVKRE